MYDYVLSSVEFQFVRPTERSVFVRFFTSSGNEVLKIDTSDPRDAVFPISPGDRTLEIRTNFEFEEKETYYVHLEQGEWHVVILIFKCM